MVSVLVWLPVGAAPLLMLAEPRAVSVYRLEQPSPNHLLKQKFTRQSRMLRPAEFKRVFQQPYRSGDNCFRILARTNGISCHRLGMAVSKKACPKAVGRNRIKRLVRESFRAQMTGQLADKALDFVVLPTAQAASKSNNTLVESLSVHWQKLTRIAANQNTGSGIPADPKDKR